VRCPSLGLQGVHATQALPLGVYGLVAGLLEGDVIATAKAHVVLSVTDAITEEPRARTARSDLQIRAMADSMASWLGDFCQVLGGRIVSHACLPVYL
jgi:hypothetical protein